MVRCIIGPSMFVNGTLHKNELMITNYFFFKKKNVFLFAYPDIGICVISGKPRSISRFIIYIYIYIYSQMKCSPVVLTSDDWWCERRCNVACRSITRHCQTMTNHISYLQEPVADPNLQNEIRSISSSRITITLPVFSRLRFVGPSFSLCKYLLFVVNAYEHVRHGN
jgi:hypothetical protein